MNEESKIENENDLTYLGGWPEKLQEIFGISVTETDTLYPTDRNGLSYAGASYEAVDYLIKRNHKKIGLIEGNKEFESSVYRKDGYLKALKDNNIPLNEDYVISGKYNLQSGYECMKSLIALENMKI